MSARVAELVVEHHREPFGIGEAAPRLTWRTAAPDAWRQAAAEIAVVRDGVEHRSTVAGADQVLVAWPGAPLASRERVEVRVRLTGEDGSLGEWSDPVAVEAGLLDPADWTAAPVGGAWAEEAGTDRRPSLVRRGFRLPAGVARARLHATAHGVYEAELNGVRVGDHTLAPGWTTYTHRLRVQTYDVTTLLAEGDNVLGAWLGDGWYRGRLGFNGGYHDLYGDDLAFLAQLEVELVTGARVVVSTDADWSAAPSPILMSGLYDGETHDARAEFADWSTPGASEDGWTPVRVGHRDPATLVASMQPPVRCTEELAPVSIQRLDDGVVLLDFGQNLVGRLRIRVDGPAGHVVELRHAEVLQKGRLYRRPLRQAASIDRLVLDGNGTREWEPRFTIHGFRYAELHGWPGKVAEGDVVARVHHTDMRRTGWFESSDPMLDRLHENVVWSMRGNSVDIPTDCPQRDERLGWTGDIQVFAPTASFLYDSAGFLASWLVDVAAEQLDDGTVPWFVPTIPGGPSWTPIQPGAVWGDVAVLTPAVLHERFGDRVVLERQYASSKAWVDLVIGLAGPDRLWDSGFQLGDWLDPAAPPEDPADASTDRYLVASAYFARSTAQLARTAELLGRTTEAREYATIAAEARDAFVRAYVRDDGTMTSDAQTAYGLAIVFDLLPEELVLSAGSRLAELVRGAGNRIATGFAGTPVVTDALSATGHVDVAYDLLLERSGPSWLSTIERGATTIWERWDSMLADGTINPGEMTSFNHYALGAVADWMHRDIAGLAPAAPAYRCIRFRPRPGGGLTRAAAVHDCPYGRIESSWTLDGDRLAYEVRLPVGTTGQVELPDGRVHEVGPGAHRFTAVVDPAAAPVLDTAG